VGKELASARKSAYRNVLVRKDWSKSMLNEMPMDNNAKNSAFNYFAEQLLYTGIVPNHNSILIEKTFDNEGNKNIVIFHALYGRRINDALSRILAIVIANKYETDVWINVVDNGFVLGTDSKLELKEADIASLLRSLEKVDILELMKENLKRTEMMKRRFRHCAARSFMVLRNYKGQKVSVRSQQVSAQLLLKAVEEMDPNFPILKETYREILEDVMDLPRADMIIKGILNGEIKYNVIETDVPSPFSHLMITFGGADIIMMKDRRRHIRELHRQVLDKIRAMKK
jgi:ATP-dependent Lhr-like helicase